MSRELQPVTVTLEHLPPSLNAFGSGNRWKFIQTKKLWQARLLEQLNAADMPACGRVMVEGELTFPDRRRRDQGNHRWMLEKALGDALVQGGFLADDDWERYSFGGLESRFERGVKRTRLILFPGECRRGTS